MQDGTRFCLENSFAQVRRVNGGLLASLQGRAPREIRGLRERPDALVLQDLPLQRAPWVPREILPQSQGLRVLLRRSQAPRAGRALQALLPLPQAPQVKLVQQEPLRRSQVQQAQLEQQELLPRSRVQQVPPVPQAVLRRLQVPRAQLEQQALLPLSQARQERQGRMASTASAETRGHRVN